MKRNEAEITFVKVNSLKFTLLSWQIFTTNIKKLQVTLMLQKICKNIHILGRQSFYRMSVYFYCMDLSIDNCKLGLICSYQVDPLDPYQYNVVILIFSKRITYPLLPSNKTKPVLSNFFIQFILKL